MRRSKTEDLDELVAVFKDKTIKVRRSELLNEVGRNKKTQQPKKTKQRHNLDKDIKIAVLRRDKKRCTKCKSKDSLQIHHIKYRENGGTDDMDNLITLCELCHAEAHRGEPVYNLMIKRLMRVKAV